MIVHPIGMMRANAAAGAEVVINFTSGEGYTLGETLYSRSDWTSPSGFGYITVADNSGTRVARASGAASTNTFIGETFADDREVYVILHDMNLTPGVAMRVDLYHTDASNRASAQMDIAGWVSFKQYIAGTEQANSGSFNSGVAPAANDKLTIARSGSTITVKKNDTTIITKTIVGTPASAPPGIYVETGTAPPYREIREFGAKDL